MPNAKELNEKQLVLIRELKEKAEQIIREVDNIESVLSEVKMEGKTEKETDELNNIFLEDFFVLEEAIKGVLEIRIFIGTSSWITLDSAESKEEVVHGIKYNVLRTLEQALAIRQTLMIIDTEKKVPLDLYSCLVELLDAAEKVIMDVF